MSQINVSFVMKKSKPWKQNYFHVNTPFVIIAVIPMEINVLNAIKK